MFVPLLLLAAAPNLDNAKYRAELELLAPEAVADFDEANGFYEKQDCAKAAPAFARVREKAPKFAAGARRLAYCLAQQGAFTEALPHAEAARDLDGSIHSSLALASVLAMRDGPGDVSRASRVLREGLARFPRELDANLLQCQLLGKLKSPDAVACFERVGVEFPGDATAQFFGAVAAGERGALTLSRERLERAHGLGLPDDQYARFKGELDHAQPFYERYWPHAVWTLGAWAFSFLALMLAGMVLSALTLAEARKPPTEQTGRQSGGSAVLHRAYRAVIFASALLFYVSLPLLLVVVVGGGGGIVYGFLAMGHVPIKLVIVVAMMVLVTIFAVLKSLFVRRDDSDPGHKLDLAEEPGLRGLLTEVAGKIQTRPVDAVYLTPGADLAVMERGSLRKRLGGNTERCLILGVGVLDGMTQGQLKSVLAHEYGHFSNRDTAGGGLALSVRMSLMSMARSLAEGGAAAWYNPAWLFFQGFFRMFLRVSQGATRLQEVLADRWATFAYGSESFAEGLTHAIRQTIRFDAHANATLKEVIEGKKALANLYAFVPAAPVATTELDGALKEAMEREPSPYDSHPRPADRIAWAKALNVARVEDAAAATAAWALFRDREALEKRMTDEIRGDLATQGLAVPGVEPAVSGPDSSAR